MGFSILAKNTMLDALTNTPDISLHTADPGALGTNAEISGGSYARVAGAFAAAASGARALSSNVTLEVPGGDTVAFVGYWDGTTFLGSSDVADELYTGGGQYKVTASGTSLSITG